MDPSSGVTRLTGYQGGKVLFEKEVMRDLGKMYLEDLERLPSSGHVASLSYAQIASMNREQFRLFLSYLRKGWPPGGGRPRR